jgi:hypothetical protein
MANGNGTPDPANNCGVGIDNKRRMRLKRQGQKRPLTQMIGDGELPMDVR